MYVVIVLLLLSMSILLYLGIRSFFKEKNHQKPFPAIKEVFKGVTKRHSLSISEVDVFRNRLIAIDRKRGKLVLIIYKNGITWEKCFNLNELIFCQLVNIRDKANNCIKSVEIELEFLNDPRIVSFVFFDEELDELSELPSRIKKSKYWEKKIQYQMSTLQVTNTFGSAT